MELIQQKPFENVETGKDFRREKDHRCPEQQINPVLQSYPGKISKFILSSGTFRPLSRAAIASTIATSAAGVEGAFYIIRDDHSNHFIIGSAGHARPSYIMHGGGLL